MRLVSSPSSQPPNFQTHLAREYDKPTEFEFTVIKSDAYNSINAYLSELTSTTVKTLEDIVTYNETN